MVVVADDLMWSTRLVEAVRRAGGDPVPLRTDAELAVVLEAHEVDDVATLGGAIVDLGGRRYEGVTAVERLHAARLPVIAVTQHDDQLARRRALAAGAGRVFSYRAFFTDGPRLVKAWLNAGAPSGTERAAR